MLFMIHTIVTRSSVFVIVDRDDEKQDLDVETATRGRMQMVVVGTGKTQKVGRFRLMARSWMRRAA